MCYLSLWDVFKFTCLLISIQNNETNSNKKLGCYNDNWQEDRPLPQLLFTDRDELSAVYSGKKYIKENFDRPYLDDIIGRCASKCEELGYDVFGIEKFAECWSGDGAYETYKKDGPSRHCFTSKYEPCHFECEGEPCAGTDHAIFVYKLQQPNKTSASCLSSKPSLAPPATKPTESTQPTSPASNLPSRATPKKTLPSSVATKPTQIKSVKPTTSWLPSRTRTNAITKPKYPWTRGISSRPTRLPSTRRTLPTEKTSPTTKTSKTPRSFPATTVRSTLPSSVATRPTSPTVSTAPTGSKGTISVTKRPPARSVFTRPTSLPSKRRSVRTPRVKPPTNSATKTAVTNPKPTIKTKQATKTMSRARPISTSPPPSAAKSSSTPTHLYSIKATLATPGTKPVSSKRPTKNRHTTTNMQSAVYIKTPTSALGRPRISCGMEHIPVHLSCPPQCQTSCTAVCPLGCCVATPLYPPAVYSSPVLPRPVYQCPYLYSPACGPRCSFKCCKAAFYMKRKDILKKRKRHMLRRGRSDLLHLKRLVNKSKGSVTHTRQRENILTNKVYE